MPRLAVPLLVLAWMASAPAVAAIVVSDDGGATLTLERPATRVVTLAPSLTELVFAAGGGNAVVATDALSDYPPAARQLPRVGDAARLDVERIVATRPDLVVVWGHGNTMRELDQLEAAGLHLFRLEPQRLADVSRAIDRLGVLLGTEPVAHQAARALAERLAALRRSHVGVAPVRVFYQVWASPLMTINRAQMVNDVIDLCGGRNVFADLAPLVPLVSTESVIAAVPEAIFTADEHGATAALRRDPGNAAYALWRTHAAIPAVRGRWLYVLNGDSISRQGPRIADGATAICQALDEVRRERAAPKPR